MNLKTYWDNSSDNMEKVLDGILIKWSSKTQEERSRKENSNLGKLTSQSIYLPVLVCLARLNMEVKELWIVITHTLSI